jgi:hypothetical protein
MSFSVHYSSLCKINQKLDALLLQKREWLGGPFSWKEWQERLDPVRAFMKAHGLEEYAVDETGAMGVTDNVRARGVVRFDHGDDAGSWLLLQMESNAQEYRFNVSNMLQTFRVAGFTL